MSDLETVAVDQPVSEEERQIEGYHKALHALFKGCGDIIIAQSVASFMGCMMAHSEQWKRLIPGYVNETMQYANVAIAAHRQAETIAQPDPNNLGDPHGSSEKT